MNILITGATKGIGKALAIAMAQNGHHLALCARNLADLESLKEQLLSINPALNIFIAPTDCGSKAQVLAFADNALAHLQTIDVLINNVGLFMPSAILNEADDQLFAHFKTNVEAPYFLYKRLTPHMIKAHKGYIINICSVASTQAIVGAGSYCVTKAALLSLNNIMREETRPFGVKVTAIIPGSTLTASWDGVEVSPDKFVQPSDVANCVLQILQLSAGANLDQLVITPQSGQV